MQRRVSGGPSQVVTAPLSLALARAPERAVLCSTSPAQEWVDRYKADRAEATAELLTLVVQVGGGPAASLQLLQPRRDAPPAAELPSCCSWQHAHRHPFGLVQAAGADSSLSASQVEEGEVDELVQALANQVIQVGAAWGQAGRAARPAGASSALAAGGRRRAAGQRPARPWAASTSRLRPLAPGPCRRAGRTPSRAAPPRRSGRTTRRCWTRWWRRPTRRVGGGALGLRTTPLAAWRLLLLAAGLRCCCSSSCTPLHPPA
jgi:hypothetical protein